jgi:putative ABC transport system ATP-binding protein
MTALFSDPAAVQELKQAAQEGKLAEKLKEKGIEMDEGKVRQLEEALKQGTMPGRGPRPAGRGDAPREGAATRDDGKRTRQATRRHVMAIVEIEDLSKVYQMGAVEVRALWRLELEIEQGEYLAIMGPSGSGKSTLLNVLGCLDRPTSGRYRLGGKDVAQLEDDALSRIRGARIGFIFQSYNLIAQLDVLENIEVPLYYQGVGARQSKARAQQLAQRVGLGNRTSHRPRELSGGQQQRVAIARALANDPLVLLADEPTGNLDTTSGAEILALLDELNNQGKTLVVVTHDAEVAQRAGRVIHLRDGQVERIVVNRG